MTTTATTLTRTELHAGGTTFLNVVRSEWVKLWSLRSTRWTIASTFIVTVGFATLICWGAEHSYGTPQGPDPATLDQTNTSLVGIYFGQLVIAVLGALVVTSEYSTGGIRTTFTAVPQRLKVVAAKWLSFGVVALVTGLVTCFVSFFIGQLFFAHKHIAAHLGDPHVLRAVVGGGLYIAGSGMFGFALGPLLRKTAAAITGAAALLFVLPLMSNLLPGSVGHTVTRYFTTNAGTHIIEVRPTEGLGPWVGIGVFTLEWAVLLVAGSLLIRRRDA